jgi:hypothetical protein
MNQSLPACGSSLPAESPQELWFDSRGFARDSSGNTYAKYTLMVECPKLNLTNDNGCRGVVFTVTPLGTIKPGG